jgi:hypothetical protein
MPWCLANFEWHVSAGESYWRCPGADATFDFRPLPEQARAGRTNGEIGGAAVVYCPTPRRGWEILGDGDWHDIKADQRMRDLFPKRRGFTPTGTTLQELIFEAMTTGSAPDGSDFSRPLMPDMRGALRCGSFSQPFRWGDAGTANIRDVIRADFTKAMQDAQAGLLKDSLHHLRVLDATCEKYRVNDWKEFVPLELQASVPGRVKHETTLSDNFNRADNTDISTGGPYTWSELSGDWGIASNGLRAPSGAGSTTGTFLARLDSDLSGTDQTVSADIIAVTTGGQQNAGTIARKDSTATVTFYHGRATKADSSSTFTAAQLFKFVAGVATQLGSDVAISKTTTFAVLTRANGSTIEFDVDGVNLISQTDSAITTGLRVGLRNLIQTVNGAMRFDNFSASDLAATGSGPLIDGRLTRSNLINGGRLVSC